MIDDVFDLFIFSLVGSNLKRKKEKIGAFPFSQGNSNSGKIIKTRVQMEFSFLIKRKNRFCVLEF